MLWPGLIVGFWTQAPSCDTLPIWDKRIVHYFDSKRSFCCGWKIIAGKTERRTKSCLLFYVRFRAAFVQQQLFCLEKKFGGEIIQAARGHFFGRLPLLLLGRWKTNQKFLNSNEDSAFQKIVLSSTWVPIIQFVKKNLHVLLLQQQLMSLPPIFFEADIISGLEKK